MCAFLVSSRVLAQVSKDCFADSHVFLLSGELSMYRDRWA